MKETEFFEAFARRPEDLHLRAVYADWLEEKGDSWRADFVRLWIRSAPWLAFDYWQPETRDFKNQWYFFDREWQRRVFDPPVPLAKRSDRRWLAAVLGGREERAAMGDDAPPSLLEDAVFGTNLLWGWPSALLFRLALAAAWDAIEATPGLPRAQLVSVLAEVEETAAKGDPFFEVGEVPGVEIPDGRPPRPSERAYNHAVALPHLLARMLQPYQARSQHLSRPGFTFDAVANAARVHEQLAWARRGFARKHETMVQAVAIAAAAAKRAAKAQRLLEAAPGRLLAEDRGSARIVRGLALATERLERARKVADEAKARADALVLACPSAPTFHGELRALLSRIAPSLVTWIRETPVLEADVLKLNVVEDEVDRWNTRRTITFGEDGRATSTYS